MTHALKKLNNIEEYILIITFPLMLLFIFLSTFSRYFDIGSLTWAEEASRYLMIWLAFAGIGYGVKNKAHLGLSFLVNKFEGITLKVLYIIRSLFIILFAAIIAYYSFLLISNQMQNDQVSPALGLPMWLVYLSVLFGGLMILIRTIIISFQDFKQKTFKAENEEEVEI